MEPGAAPDRAHLPISECEICRHLGELETSFHKYAADELDRPLPAAAGRLVTIEETERHAIRRCPECGTFYAYEESYEYLVNGSEDEETLTRLTPAQTRRFLSDQGYEDVVRHTAEDLRHESPQTRAYAAKCLTSHHLERGEDEPIRALLADADPDVVKGALRFLAQMASHNYKLPEIARLRKALRSLAGSSDPEVAYPAAKATQRLESIHRA